MSEININVTFVQNLAERTRTASLTLRMMAVLGGEAVASSPTVDSAYRHLSDRWDHRRGELADVLDGMADELDSIWKAFVTTDAELAGYLAGSGQEGTTP
jgi:hypothetical protein